jgi:subtilisin family serine protease
MNLLPVWLRKWLRSSCAPVRRPVRRTRLFVEALEDRVVPSVSSTDPAYLAWRAQTFTIDDATFGPVAAASNVSAESAAPTNSNYGSLIGLNQVLAGTSYRGQGYSVAIIDTGINYDDPDLANRVVGGYNFVANNTNYMDDNGHGTFVASEIGSSSSTLSGIAPDVNLIALKVLDSTGSGTYGNVENALDWCVAHQAQYNIVAVNLSLGSGNYTVDPYTFLESDFTTLTSAGVFIGVAAGNDYYTDGSTPGLAFPAVSPNVVSVGAVWDGNFGAASWANGAQDYSTSAYKIASFSQRSSALSILAPGAILTDDALNGGLTQMAGTSMATPVIVGASVILHQALDDASLGVDATQAYILSLMQSTGTAVVDANTGADNVSHTGLTFKCINLSAAVDAIVPAPQGPAIGAIPDQNVGFGQTATVTVSTSDSSSQTVSWSAQTFTSTQDAYALVTQYGLAFSGDYWTNLHGMNEKWLWSYAMGGLVAFILPDGTIHRYSAAGNAAMLSEANLLGRVDPSYYVNPLLLVDSVAPSSITPPATLSISGTQLTVTPNAQFSGPIYVVVTASDSQTSVKTIFVVNVSSPAPPSLGTIADQNVGYGQSATVGVSTTSNSGQPVTWSAQAFTATQDAYTLVTQYGLAFSGYYWTNLHGMNEKWLWSYSMGGLAICILPDGTIRRYDPAGTAAMLSDADLLGRVAPSYYANPLLLVDTAAPSSMAPPATLSISGTQLTVTPNAQFSGPIYVVVTATAGQTSVKQAFVVNVSAAAPPAIGAISDQSVAAGQSATVTVVTSDPNGGTVNWQAQVVTSAQDAAAVELQYQLAYTGDYWTNLHGMNEKWLWSYAMGGLVACILPDGTIRRYDPAGTSAMLSNADLLGRVDPMYYTNPLLLTALPMTASVTAAATASGSAVSAASLSITGAQLTITPSASYVGNLFVVITASNEYLSTEKYVMVTVQ